MSTVMLQNRGFKEAHRFTITESGDMFRMLSSGLYSYPVRAVIREYSTNALDSHIEAGNHNPFDVHLPTLKDPYFWIRDYGTGMSNETVREVWCSYFNSTKTDDISTVGKFGLGSKSALSYVSSFSIVSYYEGKRTRWLVLLDEEGYPTIRQELESQNTTEPNGILIRFAVPPEDHSEFEVEASDVYKYFSIKPRFVDCTEPDLSLEYCWEGTVGKIKYGIRKYNRHGTIGNRIIMGNIAYPLNIALLGYSEHSAHNCNVDIYVENDSFRIVPSREALQLTKTDESSIRHIVKMIENDVVATFEEWMDSSKHNSVYDMIEAVDGELLGWSRSEKSHLMINALGKWDSFLDSEVKSVLDDAKCINVSSNIVSFSCEEKKDMYYADKLSARYTNYKSGTCFHVHKSDLSKVDILLYDKAYCIKTRIIKYHEDTKRLPFAINRRQTVLLEKIKELGFPFDFVELPAHVRVPRVRDLTENKEKQARIKGLAGHFVWDSYKESYSKCTSLDNIKCYVKVHSLLKETSKFVLSNRNFMDELGFNIENIVFVKEPYADKCELPSLLDYGYGLYNTLLEENATIVESAVLFDVLYHHIHGTEAPTMNECLVGAFKLYCKRNGVYYSDMENSKYENVYRTMCAIKPFDVIYRWCSLHNTLDKGIDDWRNASRSMLNNIKRFFRGTVREEDVENTLQQIQTKLTNQIKAIYQDCPLLVKTPSEILLDYMDSKN
jgi:hypothetical protein